MEQPSDFSAPAGPVLAAAQQRVLDWFAAHARDLPWRRTRDPYRVLVAEVMLQQTQVDRVLPRYAAFLEAFPTLEHLAHAPAADIIRMWAGLGYNRRAVNLQRAARTVLTRHGGRFPQDVEALQQLPGVGPYTAGAVACFAFEQDVAFLDTNIRRVIRRWCVGPEDGAAALGERALWQLAQAIVPPGRGWVWNQAIMELGALICAPSAPACWRCPLRADCRAYAARRYADEQVFQPSGSVGAPAQAQRPARRLAERREAPFAGSTRYYRGRLVAVLRTLDPGAVCAPAWLGSQIKPDFQEEDMDWLEDLLEGLVRDGLVERVTDGVRLPDAALP